MRAASRLICALVVSVTSVAASTLTPPVLPLIVRNPYLSTWLQEAREAPWNRWPMFWTGQEIGFSVLAVVPDSDTVYPLLGRAQDALLPPHADDGFNVSFPVYLGAQYDASTTNLSYYFPAPSNAETTKGLHITLEFLSPITPTSTLRQSIPASYVTVHVEGEFDVHVYIDVNGQWVSGDRGSDIVWEYGSETFESGEGVKTFQIRRQNQQLLTEYYDRAEWGTLHFTGPIDATHAAGVSAHVRRRFSRTHRLDNHVDGRFRAIMDDEPIFAFSKAFHLSSADSRNSARFTLAHIQDPVVQYAAARGLTMMRPLWTFEFADAASLLTFHYFDYRNAYQLAANYSTQLGIDAYASGASDYEDIVALSARQILGATSFSGTPDNPILFLKEISSNGNFQTIDVIFPSFPFFLYTNPRWLAYLLEPLIEHMLSGQYPNDYAMHDLGAHFPNATGHPDGRDEYMPVEECGNILIMGLALVNSLVYDREATAGSIWAASGLDTNDFVTSTSAFPLLTLEQRGSIKYFDDRWGGSTKGLKQARKWVQRSYGLWKQWTRYLVDFALEPGNQLSTDDFAGWLALQTNLALKGIVGIKAMAGIAQIAGETKEAEHYEKIAFDYIRKWEKFGISRDGTHAKLAYNWFGSWTTIYNLFADALLCFHLEDHSQPIAARRSVHSTQRPLLSTTHDKAAVSQSAMSESGFTSATGKSTSGFVPSHIYQMQSDWYHYVRQKYGLPLDSRHLYTKSDWEFFAAAVTSNSTRAEILDDVARWVNETATDRPLTDLYNTEGNGGFPGPNFFARPVVGGHFAFLALERACGGQAMAGLDFLNRNSSRHVPKDSQSESDDRPEEGGESIDEARLARVEAAARAFRHDAEGRWDL